MRVAPDGLSTSIRVVSSKTRQGAFVAPRAARGASRPAAVTPRDSRKFRRFIAPWTVYRAALGQTTTVPEVCTGGENSLRFGAFTGYRRDRSGGLMILGWPEAVWGQKWLRAAP